MLRSETPGSEGCLFVKQLFAVLVEGQQQQRMISGLICADKTIFNGTVIIIFGLFLFLFGICCVAAQSLRAAGLTEHERPFSALDCLNE